MKKIIMMFTFVAAIATNSFAQQSPGFSIGANGGCVSTTTSVLLKAQFPEGLDTSGAQIGWRYLIHDGINVTNNWIPITDSNRAELVVANFPATQSREYVFVVTIHGITYRSSQITLCYCGTTAVSTIDILSGGIGIHGEAVLQLQRTKYLRVALQMSSQVQMTWTEIADVTDSSFYIGHERVIGTVFYRLEALQDDGSKKYGKIYPIRELTPKNSIDFSKPIDHITVFDMNGNNLGTWSNKTFAGQQQVFEMATENLAVGAYVIVCRQGPIGKVIRNVKMSK